MPRKTSTPAVVAPEATPATPEVVADAPVAKTPKWVALTAEEAAAAALVARPAISPCLCGCDATTKGRFAPGHDATHHRRLLATLASDDAAAVASATAALTAFGWEVA